MRYSVQWLPCEASISWALYLYNPCNLHVALGGRGYYCPPFTDEEAGVQRGWQILPHHAIGLNLACQIQPGPLLPSAPSHPVLLRHSLRVQLVQGAVHAHSDLQVLEPLVFPPLLHDGSHACATELGRPAGHSATHLLHHDAVLARAVQAELLQDPPHLEEGQPIAAGRKRVIKKEQLRNNLYDHRADLTGKYGGRGGGG